MYGNKYVETNENNMNVNFESPWQITICIQIQ